MLRLHVPGPLAVGQDLSLDATAARHVQVRRLQPGDTVVLFDGRGGEWCAEVAAMRRDGVDLRIRVHVAVDRELPWRVTLAMGMPANDRMDALVEKATELGVHAIQPLICERSVLRLDGERALKKVAHWQAVAISACEQSGRAVVPQVRPVQTLQAWLKGSATETTAANWHKGVLSLRDAVSLREWLGGKSSTTTAPGGSSGSMSDGEKESPAFVFLSGPEGGLSESEEQAALNAGWTAITLGTRVLRADTAPLAALSVIGATFE